MKTARFEVFQGKDEQWYWSLKSANNRIVAQGEGYTRQFDAVRAAEMVARTAYYAHVESIPKISIRNQCMACKSCLERRKKLQGLRDAKKLKRQGVQAAAIGAVLGAFEAGGKMLGINGEEENERQQSRSTTGAEAPTPTEPSVQDESGRGESD